VTGPPLLTASEVADLLGVCSETVLRWTRDGSLPGFRVSSRSLRYSAEAIDAWLADRATVKAADADEVCDEPDAPTARREDTATTLRPVTSPGPDVGTANEED
jgi:excisionase family DNA binding protein